MQSENSDLEEDQFTSVTVKTLCKQNGYRKQQFQSTGKCKPAVTDITQKCLDAVKHTSQVNTKTFFPGTVDS